MLNDRKLTIGGEGGRHLFLCSQELKAQLAAKEEQMKKQGQQLMEHKRNEKYLSKKLEEVNKEDAKTSQQEAKDIAKRVETEKKRKMVKAVFQQFHKINTLYAVSSHPD